jgi:HPt (histidine-containing phosphotransfer) domain-containing protein
VAFPPDPIDPGLAARFELLRQQFLASLARRAREIDEAGDQRALHGALHQLAGAAGSFGHPELGEMARRAMRAIDTDDTPALDVTLERLRAAMRALGTP